MGGNLTYILRFPGEWRIGRVPHAPSVQNTGHMITTQAVQDLVDGVYLVSTEDCVQLAAFQVC